MPHKAFIPAKSSSSVLPMAQIFHRAVVDGDVGLEIEVEGNKFKKEYIPKPWKYVHDGSLRGEDCAEYLLRNPIAFEEVPEACHKLWEMMENYGSVLDDSNRTSVHVHLNFGREYKDRVCCFVSLFFIVEEILMEWCGDHRVGNLFCLRGKDAPALVTKIKEFLSNDSMSNMPNGLHYANLNIHALQKMGSIEVRGMRGAMNSDEVILWVSVLERIYKLSDTYDDPREICEGLSGIGPIPFVNEILGDKFNDIVDAIGWTHQQLSESSWEGIRMAQDLCYCRDWSKYKKPDLDNDPFGRRSDSVNPYAQSSASSAGPAPYPTASNVFVTNWENTHEEEIEDFEEDYYDEDEEII